VNSASAGELSALPSASSARTSTRCGPSASDGAVHGEEQDRNPPPSTLHSNVALASGLTNSTRGVRSVVCAAGAVTITVSGPIVSTVNTRSVPLPMTPAGLVAAAAKTCSPFRRSATGVKLPDEHATAAPSSLHWKVARGTLVKVNVGRCSRVGPSGPPVKVTAGTVESTVKLRVAAGL
jgi:hypothetical protein